MKINNLHLGADPELFLEKNGEIISAEGLIGGTKRAPKPISKTGHYIQEDNIMIEFNIPASNSKKEFRDNINYVKDYLEILAQIQKGKLNFSASAELDPKYLNTYQARLFGCDPDFNVYLKCVNDPPNPKGNLRTCGGHIHIGYDNPTQDVSEEIIYALDFTLGLESVNLDEDDRRREMYGNAGCFRFKEYGVEYRTLSNFWIKDDKLINWAYDKAIEAVDLVNSGLITMLIKKYSNEVKNIIDNNNKKEAINLLATLKQVKQEELIKK